MGNIFSDKNRAKSVATFLGNEIPGDLVVMENRRKAALAVNLELNVPDITGVDPDDVAATLNGAQNASEDTFNRVRMAAVTQVERAYAGLVSEYVKASYPAVAERYNSAAETFTANFRIDRFPMIHASELDPAGLSAADIGLYAAARDAHAVLSSALDLTLRHIVVNQVGRADWHRRIALAVKFETYDDAYNLANMDKNTSQGVFGLFGIVARENYRAGDNPPYVLEMPATLDEYADQMDILAEPNPDWDMEDPTAPVKSFGRRVFNVG